MIDMEFKHLNEDGTDNRLTPKQQQTLDYIALCIEENKQPPTIREIQSFFGNRSPSPAQQFVKELKRKGFIDYRRGFPRDIKILPTDEY